MNITFDEFDKRYAVAFEAALTVLHNSSEAEDVAQDALLALTKKAEMPQKVEGWLYRVSHNLAVVKIRSEMRRRKREKEFQAMNDFKETPVELSEALDSLSFEQKKLISEYFYDRIGQNELSKLYNVNQATISRQLVSIIWKLRKKLKEIEENRWEISN